MDLILLLARLVLAVVFAVSGIAKLLDRAGTRRAMLDFGVPPRLAAAFGVGLPLAELAVVFALIPRASAWFGAAGALALLALFCVGIVVNLARGKTPDCHCFGQLHSEPIGWRTLARNGVLAAIAGAFLGLGLDDPGPSAVAWIGDLSTAAVATLAAGAIGLALVAVLGWVTLHLLQQNGRILSRLEHLEGLLTPGDDLARPAPVQAFVGLPIGTPAPSFNLPGIYGETMTLDALRASGKPVMLLFSDPGCVPCNALLPTLGAWQRAHADKLTLALISRGTADSNRPKSAEHGILTTLLQKDREVSDAYKAHGTPSAVIVNADGSVGSAVAGGADAIEQLVNRAVRVPPIIPLQPAPVGGGRMVANGNGGSAAQPIGQAAQPVAPRLGHDAHALALPDLDGNAVDLAGFRGQSILILFWNPGCGFCERMLPDLRAWEANPPADAPRLLVVSTGSIEVNRAMALRSTVVLDQGFNAGQAFGATGTPSAVLVDATGKIASQVAVGAPAVLALAGYQAV
ncbi:MAG TPA: MauE/DoxX family redox-associated membrane protein [Thermomicrobiales bacterium]|nr:MauE/DoxX family redox-associated membrane protein [Thermomicrobiales bacterium]